MRGINELFPFSVDSDQNEHVDNFLKTKILSDSMYEHIETSSYNSDKVNKKHTSFYEISEKS